MNNVIPRTPTLEEMQAWVNEAEKMVAKHFEENYGTLKPNVLELMPGKKYARIVCLANGDVESRSSWGFLDMTNGDVLKSETWNKPAKHARGNIFTHTPAQCCNWTGPNYLR